jgi:hypothetical protein
MTTRLLAFMVIFLFVFGSKELRGQGINHYKTDKLDLIYIGKRYSYLLPHVSGTYENARAFHAKFWNYKDSTTSVLLNDFEDFGHAGALVMPFSQIQMGIEPYSFAFSIVPSNERFQWLFNHEFTHIVMADKANKQDLFFRKMLFGKVRRSEEKPLSAVWSYLTTPRWYSPRWYQEGIACFMETWMSGGMGRALGPYDEMYFRSIVNENAHIYSVVGLETEGTSIDFQVGTNSYLYGTRFVTYLSSQYGVDKLKAFYTRTDDSKASYAKQFKQVYNRSLSNVWDEWIGWETDFQKENIEKIKGYPLTKFKAITPRPIGGVSNYGYNPSTRKIYAAINSPGSISQIAEIDQKSGVIRKIATLDSPLMYYCTDLAYNPDDEKIYISEQNGKRRNLVEVDVHSGKKRVLNPMTRTGSLVFNRADKCLWGVRNDNGYNTIVKIPKPYTEVVPIYTAPLGKTFFDLAISNKGDRLSASLSGLKGEQSLILFELKDLDQGHNNFRTIYELSDNTLTQFKFSADDQFLIGASYYTGVSNIWRLNIDKPEFELLSNVETGMFMPLQMNADSLLVLKFNRDGMVPGTIPINVIKDANTIEYQGNLVHQKYPEVENWALTPTASVKKVGSSVLEEGYSPIRQMRLANAYPDIAGYKKSVAIGYRLNWRDPMAVSNIDLFLATSPWSDYKEKQKIHVAFEWTYFNWHLKADYNKTHFYDLFGPTLRSRSGYSVGINYKRDKAQKLPFKSFYNLGISTYGDIEVLPGYQNIASPIRNLQVVNGSYGLSKLRKTLGAVVDEKGYSWDINSSGSLAKGEFYPSLISNQSIGFLVPVMRNTSFWIRNSIGQSMGNRQSSLSYFYFGGFRNNFIDWQPSEQYRLTHAFPGAEIDEIDAYNFVKTMGELNLKPIRLRNVGASWLYPTFVKSSVFTTHMMTNFDKKAETSHLFNVGAQVDIQLVLFSYLKTTWSLGYARKYENHKENKEQFMISLKLLGD